MKWAFQVLSGLVLLFMLLGCGQSESKEPAAKPRSRVVAAKAKEQAPVDPKEEFCDVAPKGGAAGAKLSYPKLANTGVEESAERVWLNVWASWCKPCVEELPLLKRWESRLSSEGVDVSLRFLSADETEDALQRFAKKHTEVRSSLRVKEPDALPKWLVSIGLDEGAPLPIHVLTDVSGKVVCVRAGAVGEDDYPHIKKILSSN